jgi:cysteine-rich repeat protein
MNAGGPVYCPRSSSMTSTQQSRATSRRAQLILACASVIAAIAVATTVMSSCIDDGTMLCPSGLRCPPGSACTQDGDECTKTACGDGHTDPDAGEGCDDGNLKFGDGCRGDCRSTEECGNGFQDIGEECDDGTSGNNEFGTCGRDCQRNCGNGVLDPMEVCDGSFSRDSCLDFGFDRGPLICSQECAPRSERCAHIGWEREERPGDTGSLQGVWGDASKQIFAVGQESSADGHMAALHFDGTVWVDAKPPIGSGRLLEVWGSGPRDVFVVGEVGRVLYYDGAWLPLLSGVTVTLRDVWGSGPQGDVLAVGDDTTIVRYTRSTRTWNVEAVPSSVTETTALEAVWGEDETDSEDELDIYAVGQGGTILHRTTDGWIHEAAGLTDADLFDVWGTNDGEVFAAGEGGIILQGGGADGWSIMDTASETTLYGLWGNSANQVFAVGERGTVLFYDGRTWSPLESGTDVTLTAVWGVPGYGIVAVAQNGLILRYAGWSWVPMPEQPDGGAIRSLWARGLDDVYALTENVVYPQRFDGKTWRVMDEGFASLDCMKSEADGTNPLRHLWGSREGDLYAVGDDSLLLLHQPRQGWTCMAVDLPQPVNLHRVWSTEDGHLFAVGEVAGKNNGVVVSYDEGTWRQVTSSDAPLRGIWGEKRDELFAVGDRGTILYYNKAAGPGWERVVAGTSERLNAIWGSSITNIYVVGENGETLQFDGTRWNKLRSNSNEHLLDLWGSRSGHVFAIGENGSMFHRRGRENWGKMSSETDQNLTTVHGLETPLGNPHAVMFGGEGDTFRRFLVNEDVLVVY